MTPATLARRTVAKRRRYRRRLVAVYRDPCARPRESLAAWEEHVRALEQREMEARFERDRHLLLRTIVELRTSGGVGEADDVLVVGPRHVDELRFFQRDLGLPKTVGLDLFDEPAGPITGGDMHRMPFEDGRFRLVFCAGALSYAWDVRLVVREMARVCRRPAYLFLMDSADRPAGPDPLGRIDLVNERVTLGLFAGMPVRVLCRDAGRSLNPTTHRQAPCVAVELLS
jgi:SAM-dependent methyltransferase